MSRIFRFSRLIPVLLLIVVLLPLRGVAAQDKVKIVWWNIFTGNDQELAKTIAADFEKAHPNVTIEITSLENDSYKQKMTTVMQAGNPPDLFHSWGGGVLQTFYNAGLLRDITPELTANNSEWLNSFSAQSALDLYKFDTKYYGVAYDWGAVGMWYNKALFAKAGIKDTPKTWAELLEDVKALKAAGITPIALGEKEKWPGHFWWVYLAIRLGGKDAFDKAYNRTGSFADESFVKAGELLKQLVDLDPFPVGFEGLTYPDESAVMGNGLAAIELQGQWAKGVQMSSSENGKGVGEDLGWFPFPMVEGGAGDPDDALGGGNGVAVGKNAPPEAVEFLKFLTSPESQKRFIDLQGGFVPTAKDAEKYLTDPLLQAVMAARNKAKYFQLYYDQYLPPALAGAVADATEGIFNKALSPEDAAQMIEAEAAIDLAK